jgi:L-fuconolactonase
MFIDCHVHFWNLSRGDYVWINPNNSVLYKNYLPPDLLQHQIGNYVDGVVAVQAANTVEETDFLLSIAEEYSIIKGVIGWLDVTSEHFPYLFERLQTNTLFKGIRYSLNHLDTNKWRIDPIVVRNLQLLENDDYTVDLLINPKNILYILRLLEYLPELKVTINHLGAPPINQRIQPWMEMMTEISKHKQATCKLSGMITLGKGFDWSVFKPIIAHLFANFGIDRLMFGSDWPVCLLGGNYKETIDLFYHVLPEKLHSDQIRKLIRENAIRHYHLSM